MMPSFVTRLSGEGQRMEPARWRMLEPMNERHQPWVAVCDVFVGLWEKEREISSLCRLSVIRMTVCVDVLRGPEAPDCACVVCVSVCVCVCGLCECASGYITL